MSPNENTSSLYQDLQELVSAEDFLEYFGVQYDPHVVQVNRLHILQRFHDYLEGERERGPEGSGQAEEASRDKHARLLARAYRDFVDSDARTEKVFAVFRRSAPVLVPLDSLTE